MQQMLQSCASPKHVATIVGLPGCRFGASRAIRETKERKIDDVDFDHLFKKKKGLKQII